MKLSERLSKISQYISKNDRVADIGSDHGQLAIFLAREKGVLYVYASDNKKGPFSQLRQAVKDSQLENIIHLGLKDGLSDLPSEVDTVIIAGMGGDLIADILNQGIDKLDRIRKLVLAPNNSEENLRKVVSYLGFSFKDETVVYEDGHYYDIMVLVNDGCMVCGLETLFGPINLIKKETLFLQKWQEIYQKNERLLQENLSPERRREILYIQERIKTLW